MYPAPKIKFIGENVIRAYHPEPLEPFSFLTASVAAAGVTLTLKSNLGFSNTDPQDLILFERLGNEAAEIKRVNGTITAGTSLTVQALTLAHPIDTPVSKILFDQIVVTGGTTAAIAASGSGTIVQFAGSDTTNINVSGPYTDFIVTGTTYAYYSARFYNSLATTAYYSGYADGVAATGLDSSSVGAVISLALENLGESVNEKFSMPWLLEQVYQAELDVSKRLKRWSWLVEHDYDAGNLATGDEGFTLPTDIADAETDKSILGLRLGTGPNLWYQGKAEFEEDHNGVAFTTLSSTAAIGATTLVLTDSRDFEDSGSVNIAGTSYAYTGNTRSTNTLTGLTALAAEITSGNNVWQNATFSEPLRYTVTDGDVLFECPVESELNGRNVWLDYYKKVTKADSDGDLLSVPDSGVVRLYVERSILEKKMGGSIPLDHAAHVKYEQRVKALITNEMTGQPLRLVPQTVEHGFNKRFRTSR